MSQADLRPCASPGPDTPMLVVEDGNVDEGLAFRREVKYGIKHADVGRIRSVLDANMRRIWYNERVSTVRSIYFDDLRLTACRQNLAGIGRRQKIRLRWYDELVPPAKFFFETKWRNGLASGKQRIQIVSAKRLSSSTYSEIIDGLGEVLPAQHGALLARFSEPIALVEYRREHFRSRHSLLRVTLDYDLVFYDQWGARYPSLSFGQKMYDFAVVEAKVPVGSEGSIREALHPLRLRVTRNSKYLAACQLLGSLTRATIPI